MHFKNELHFTVGLLRCLISCWHEMLGTVYTVDCILPYLASPPLPTLFGDASAGFSCCFWFSCYCTQQTQPQSLPLGFSPVLHPGLHPGSSEMLPSSPLSAAHFPVISSPKHSFPNPYTVTHTSPFYFFILQTTFTVSLPLKFLSLLFPSPWNLP